MPLLEQPRQAHTDPTLRLKTFARSITNATDGSRRNWPVVWLSVQMLGFAIGGHADFVHHFTERMGFDHPAMLVRLTAILPAFFFLRNKVAISIFWLLILIGNIAAGAMETHHRNARVTATIAQPWAVAQKVEYQGEAVLRITGWVRDGDNKRWSAPAQLLAWRSELKAVPEVGLGTGVQVTGVGERPDLGQLLAGTLTLTVAPEGSLRGSFDYRKFLTGRRLPWRGNLKPYRKIDTPDRVMSWSQNVFAPLRSAILSRLEFLLPPREAKLASAVLLGLRSSDSKQISSPFTSLGLAHLFAVSGLHVGILLGIILVPGKLLHFSPRMSVAPLWIFVPLYLLLTGMPGSVVRAGGMGLMAAQAKALGRRSDPLRLLGILYWWGSLGDPLQNIDAGLQLSYLAAGGILLVGRATGGFQLSQRKLVNLVVVGLAVGLAAQWFTMPVIAASFGFLSLVSPLANLVAVPLFALAIWCVVLALVMSTVWLPLGQCMGALAWLLLRAIAGAVSLIAQLTGGFPLGLRVPGPGLISVWVALSIAFVFLILKRGNSWPRHVLAWAICPTVLVIFYSPLLPKIIPNDSVEVWQFDVGQGDCGLVSFPDGWTGIIDTGGRFGHRAPPEASAMARTVLPHLRRQGINEVELVILSHGHYDHTGGAIALAQQVDVKSWLVAGRAGEAIVAVADSLSIRTGLAGDILHTWQDWELIVLYPLRGQDHADGENNWSSVVALNHRGRTQMMWSGDLELEGEETLLAVGPDIKPTRVWKAGHHGSNTSGSPELLAHLRPELILVSCGLGNGYHHPSHGPFVFGAATERDTVPLLRTDMSGSIRLRWAPDGEISWQTVREKGELPALP